LEGGKELVECGVDVFVFFLASVYEGVRRKLKGVRVGDV